MIGVSGQSSPLIWMVLIGSASLVPFFALAVTSFLKLSVVLSIFRNALGAQQVPSGAVVGLLAFVLTVHVMAPVGRETLQIVEQKMGKDATKTESKVDPQVDQIGELRWMINLAAQASVPLEKFLRKHSGKRERVFFAEHTEASEDVDLDVKGESFTSLIPAFVLSELRSAFMMGFVIYLPFLIVDLVVINVLMALGMMMVSPVTVSLPLKLLLFVLCDGWFLLSRGLILSYQ